MTVQRGRTVVGGNRPTGFRVWIAARGRWQPAHARDRPPHAIALEPAEERIFTAREAARYVKAFNRTARAQEIPVWAIALPVVVRYEGDLRPGEKLLIPRTLMGFDRQDR